jgi:hypothetical protein
VGRGEGAYVGSGDAVLLEESIRRQDGVVGLEEHGAITAAAEQDGLAAGRVELDKVGEVVDLAVKDPELGELLLGERRSFLLLAQGRGCEDHLGRRGACSGRNLGRSYRTNIGGDVKAKG